MKRALAVPLLVVACSIAVVGIAWAGQPTVQRYPFSGTWVDEGSCGFAVKIEGSGYLLDIAWIDANGYGKVIETAPQAKWVLTNLETSKVIQVSIAGPGQYYFPADGSFKLVGTGSWGWFSNPETGEPGLFLMTGRFVFSIDPAGNESFTRVGGLSDLCARLAP